MHKKIASDLTSLAHSILRMKNKDDVFALKEKAHEVYEKLSVLAYVEEYINTTPNAEVTKEELIAKITEAEVKKEEVLSQTEKIEEEAKEDVVVETITEVKIEEEAEVVVEETKEETITENEVVGNVVEEIIEQPFDELERLLGNNEEDEKFNEATFIEETKAPTLEEELKDTVSVDVMADLFTKAVPKKSLNDRLQNTIQIGLNDRIAFVKHLFDNDAADFNRVVSQLNTFDTEKEAKKFINKTVKPDYDWSDKEEYETRFLEIVERKFN